MTGRGQAPGSAFSFANLPLFTALLPSFVAHAEPGFEYRLYLGFDVGDVVFDSDVTRDAIDAWAARHVVAPLAARTRARGGPVRVRVATLRFENPLGKPGPAMNYVMAAAFADGADFLARMNDDAVLRGPWAAASVRQLRAFAPSGVGVVGPACASGCGYGVEGVGGQGQGGRRLPKGMLPQDVVHRTHLLIFDTYYPLVFTDWYMDEWISGVYGPSYTRGGVGEISHWVGPAAGAEGAVEGAGVSQGGGRFLPDVTHRHWVPSLVRHGHKRVVAWVKKRLLSDIRAMAGAAVH